jgi:hypothetical protein
VGHYLGTAVDGKWWKRYRGRNFFARGNGEYEVDAARQELRFRRYLTREPIVLPFGLLEDVTVSAWHAGKWCLGKPIVVLHWCEEGKRLSSGFLFSSNDRDRVWACLAEHAKGRGRGSA